MVVWYVVCGMLFAKGVPLVVQLHNTSDARLQPTAIPGLGEDQPRFALSAPVGFSATGSRSGLGVWGHLAWGREANWKHLRVRHPTITCMTAFWNHSSPYAAESR